MMRRSEGERALQPRVLKSIQLSDSPIVSPTSGQTEIGHRTGPPGVWIGPTCRGYSKLRTRTAPRVVLCFSD